MIRRFLLCSVAVAAARIVSCGGPAARRVDFPILAGDTSFASVKTELAQWLPKENRPAFDSPTGKQTKVQKRK